MSRHNMAAESVINRTSGRMAIHDCNIGVSGQSPTTRNAQQQFTAAGTITWNTQHALLNFSFMIIMGY